MNVVASLKRKYGPLPAWAWLGVLAAVLVVYRYFRPGAPASSSDTSSTDTGAPSSADYARGRVGGDAGALAPTDQTLADPGVTGPGTAVVFDPLTGNTDEPPLTGGTAPRAPFEPAVPPTARPVTATKTPAPGGRGIPTPAAAAVIGIQKALPPPPKAKPRKKKPAPRPASSRGQTAPRPTLATNRADAAAVAHPASAAHAPSAAPPRKQQNAAAAVARPRSETSVHVDTGARAVASTSTVGVATTPAQARAMGRKMEVD